MGAQSQLIVDVNDSWRGHPSKIGTRLSPHAPRELHRGFITAEISVDGIAVCFLVDPGALHSFADALGRLADEFSKAVGEWHRAHGAPAAPAIPVDQRCEDEEA